MKPKLVARFIPAASPLTLPLAFVFMGSFEARIVFFSLRREVFFHLGSQRKGRKCDDKKIS
jgi:hypothetical protein